MPSRRVPIDRRLSTKRFKTLQQRNEDNDRRQAKRWIESTDNPEAWEDVRELKHGGSWEPIAEFTRQVRERREAYRRGVRNFDDWEPIEPPDGMPASAAHYHD